LKFIVDDKLVIVFAEDDILVSKPPSTSYIEATEEALETSFQALEIANAGYVKEGMPIVELQSSDTSMMVAKIMLKNGYQCGHGLGRNEQGLSQIPKLMENKGRFGLGYKPSKADRRRVANEKREKRLARLKNRELKTEGVPLCDIRESFYSAGFEFPSLIVAVEEDITKDDDNSWVHACSPNMELGNWETIEFPVTFNSNFK